MSQNETLQKIRTNGILMMILASFFFSWMGALGKWAMQTIPPMETVFFRAIVSAVILLPWMIHKKVSLLGNNKNVLLSRGLCGFLALSLSFYVTSKIQLANAAILNHTSVFFVAFLSAVIFNEKLSTALMGLILIAFLGCLLIIKPTADVFSQPGFIGLLSGLFASLAYISIKQLHKTDSNLTIVFYFSLISAVGSLLFFPFSFRWPTPFELLILIGVGLCGTIAQILMTKAYQCAPATVVSPYSFSSVLFSGLWGYLVWQETIDIYSFIGGLIIIIAGIGLMKAQGRITKVEVVEPTL